MKRRSSAKKHYEEMMAKFRMPRLDRTRYTDLSHQGLEGPFMFKGGEVLYYDTRAGKYYDRDADMYLSDRDADRITSAYRNASAVRVARRYLQAGSGLKAVKAVLPGVSDRQANHFLHALAGSIVDPDNVRTLSLEKIEGGLNVNQVSSRHPSDPEYPEEVIDGVSGLKTRLVYEINLRSLAKLAKMDLSGLTLENKRAVKALCEALTKNIENNILKSNSSTEELNLIFGDVQHEVEAEVPEYHEINEIHLVEYDFKIIGLEVKRNELHVLIDNELEYEIWLDFDKDAQDEDWL
jgi:hypothetical protein